MGFKMRRSKSFRLTAASIAVCSIILAFNPPFYAAENEKGQLPPPPAAPDVIMKPANMPTVEPSPQPSPGAPLSGEEAPGVLAVSSVAGAAGGTNKIISEGGKKISLDLKGIDVTELFRILALKMGVSIVPSKSVAGRVNIYLNNVSLEDALDIILVSQDLAAVHKGSIITIMTAGEYEKTYGKKYNEQRQFASLKLNYAKPSAVFNALTQIKSDIGKIIVDEQTGTILLMDIPEKLELEKKAIAELDQPLDTEIISLKYSKSADMKAHLATEITTGAGEILVDERSGKVAVSDLPEKVSKIRRIITAFDSPPLQVFIEAEIVELTLSKEFDRGINWDKLFNEEQWIKWAKLVGLHLTGTYMLSSLAASTATAQTISVGYAAPNTYTAILKFLQTYGDTKILSRPRISVINNQEARIMVGTREAYIIGTQSQSQLTTITADNVQFIDVGVKLNVVPSINEDGYITMKIKPEISSVTSTLTTTSGSSVPIVSTSEAETVVKVKDGTMIMIAGLFKETKTDATAGLPYLSKMPIIDIAFSNRKAETKREELIVFITPRIIKGDVMLPGTSPEDYVPPDMLHREFKKSIVDRKMNEITPRNKKEEKGLNELPPPPIEENVPGELNIEEKMKGIKR